MTEPDEGERRSAEKVQDALFRIAELAGAARDMKEFYAAIHAIVGELMFAGNFYIALYDPDRQRINFPYYVDEALVDIPDPDRWDEFGSGNAKGTTAYVLRTGEPQLIPYERNLELAEQGEIELLGAITTEASWLGVPLKAEGRTIGVLVVQSYTKDVQYTEDDKDLLAFVGQHVGAALSRARAIEETRQRNAELALINSVQDALAGELELQAIYDLVGDKLQEVFDAQVVAISILDASTGLISFPYVVERGGRSGDRRDAGDRLSQARHGDRRAADDQRGHGRRGRAIWEPARAQRGAGQVCDLRPTRRRREVHRSDFSPERRPRARVHGFRRAPAGHSGRQPQRRARERTARPRDAAARRRAGDRQQRRAGARGAPRPRRADRARRRPATGDVRGRHRLRRAARRGIRPDRLPLLLRARRAAPRAADCLRRGPYLQHHRVRRAAAPEHGRGRRAAGGRDAVAVVPRRPGPGRRPPDRRDQRPEHARGRPLRRRRRAPARHARGERRRRDPERAAVRRDRAPEAVLRVARRDQPDRRRGDGRRRAGDRLEPGSGGALRLLVRGGDRPHHRRPRAQRRAPRRGPRRHARGGREGPHRPGHAARAQGRLTSSTCR